MTTFSPSRFETLPQPTAKPLFIAIAAACVVGLMGGLATDIGPWYRHLVKPSWQPPDWLFGPVWTTIYALVVTAAVRGWRRAASGTQRRWMIGLLTANATVNVLWSFLFFHLQRPDWALVEIGVLWSSILAVVIVIGRVDRIGGLLVAPYLCWVGFASFLDLTIVQLNVPFPGR